MPTKRIDPTERALDAYFQLDTDQMAHFHAVIRYATRAAQIAADRGPDHCAPQDETVKRGRPKGSKNRKPAASPLSPEGFEPSALFAANGAVTEDL